MRTVVFDRGHACLKNGWSLAKLSLGSEGIVILRHLKSSLYLETKWG